MELVQSTILTSVRLRGRLSGSWLGYLFDLVGTTAIFLFATYITWGTWKLWIVPVVFYQAVCMIAAVILGKWVLFRRPHRVPGDRVAVATIWVVIVYGALGLWLVFSRSYYSRSFLMASFALLLAWQVFDLLLVRTRPRPLRIAAVPSPLVEKLIGVSTGIEVHIMRNPDLHTTVDAIVVDMHEQLSEPWTRFLAEAAASGIPVYHAASIHEVATTRVSLQYVHAGLLHGLFHSSQAYLPIKRIFDIACVLISLPIVLPLCLILALLVKWDSPGPALFWQERVGQGGRVFRMVKFRSMRIDSEKDGAKFARNDDDRITRLGRIMRKYRLDELPQLWNVLKGEMSLIGPRPEQVDFARQFEKQIPFYRWRHRVKPGITGWAQVQQGYAAGVEDTLEKLEYDLFYLKHLSFWLDLSIVFRTIRTVMTGFGAR